MARKKAKAAKGPRKAKPRRRDFLGTNLKKTMAAAAILLTLVAAAGLLLHHSLKDRRTATVPAPVPKPPVRPPAPAPAAPRPTFEIFPQRDTAARPPVAEGETPHKRPKVAIIIDDVGYDRKTARQLIDLGATLTFSILPFAPFDSRIADAVHAKGFEIMLHLPMEPMEYPHVDPGPGALLSTMSPDQLVEQLSEDLKKIPYARGVNNHMGSRMTANSTQLYQIFTILKKQNLYFVDSRTTAETLCRPSARLFQLAFSQRDVFLDNVQQVAAVRRQLLQLVKIAQNHGEAVGIGHPYPVTREVLREMLPEIAEKVDLVPASALVHSAG